MHLEDSAGTSLFVSLTHLQDSIEMDNSKNRIIISLMIAGLLAACQAPGISADAAKLFVKPAKNELIVGTDENGCPTDVFSMNRTCLEGVPDPANVTCQTKGSNVRWYPYGDPIKISFPSTNDPTTRCGWHTQGYYQCTIPSGTKAGSYAYDVLIAKKDTVCGTDPRIIIK